MSLTLTTPVANDVVRFLIDRLDDDDRELDHLSRARRRGADHPGDVRQRTIERIRAEIVAKRHVIGDLQHLVILRDQPVEKPVRDTALLALRAMAACYDEHRDYRAAWRVV